MGLMLLLCFMFVDTEQTSGRAGLAGERKVYKVPNFFKPNNSEAANTSYTCIPMTALTTFLVVLVGVTFFFCWFLFLIEAHGC